MPRCTLRLFGIGDFRDPLVLRAFVQLPEFFGDINRRQGLDRDRRCDVDNPDMNALGLEALEQAECERTQTCLADAE
jgi:hypothetical protein